MALSERPTRGGKRRCVSPKIPAPVADTMTAENMVTFEPSARAPVPGIAGLGLTAVKQPLAWIDGWPVNVCNIDDTVAAAIEATAARRPTTIFTLNLDHVVKLRRDPKFRTAYAKASIVTADGAPVVWLGRSQEQSLVRTTGADLVIPLAKAAAQHKFPVAFFGGQERVLATAAARLRTLAGADLDIVYQESPPMKFDPTGDAAVAALERIVASGARIVFVALGAPKQELMSAMAAERGLPLTFACIGAGLDFIAEVQTRAPKLMQSTGLEWLWRLASEPRRLARRYADCAGVLADLAVVQPTIRYISTVNKVPPRRRNRH